MLTPRTCLHGESAIGQFQPLLRLIYGQKIYKTVLETEIPTSWSHIISTIASFSLALHVVDFQFLTLCGGNFGSLERKQVVSVGISRDGNP